MFRHIRLAALVLCWFVLPNAALAEEAAADRLRTIASEAYDGNRPGASVIVYRNGEILLHEAYGLANLELGVAMTTANRFRIASVTKQFTGATVMRLVEDGVLDLDANIRTYLPDFADKGDTITLRHLLGHTSGLYNYTNHDDYEAIAHTDISLQDTCAYFEDLPLDFPVGSEWSYSNSGYALTSLIIETVTGREFEDIVAERIFASAGMTQSQFQLAGQVMANSPNQYWHGENGFYPAQRAGISGHGDGEIYSTTGDLLQWYQALRDDRLFNAETRETFYASQILPDGRDTRYGLGLFHGRVGPYATYEHGGNVGGWRAYVIMVPEQDAFVALLANANDTDEGLIASRLMKAALGLENGASIEISLEQAALEGFVGTYRHGPGDVRRIRFEAGRIQSSRGGGNWHNLVPIGESRFMFQADPDTQIQFTDTGLNVSYRYGMDHEAVRIEEE
ncbi:serine hydrolase domain-containing protein [Parasphingopyxis lamellibrachiae]|uniref:CubicO group peptidase (Beta-lactamase class C family) n=1 Tax=Parasphingopyxis lamellibrachiae TaxID=680125 RepID=A0A3D9FFF3_9SPHN|nr:serine hydrolase domain-containing protein [Parasphingopyxis lamellibrachiae]RED16302.1 CubicO group peptidase (beta-lactamase class C family) [Parasphingopyxis lamellibrachiae]